jgi:biopolymer transport protein ExbD
MFKHRDSSKFAAALALSVAPAAAFAQASSEPSPQSVKLVVTASGQYVLAGKPVEQSKLREELRALKSRHGQVDLHVIAGPSSTYQQLAPVMQVVQQEGLAKSALIVSPSPPSDIASQPGKR